MDVLNDICEQRSQKLILRGSVIIDRLDVKEEQVLPDRNEIDLKVDLKKASYKNVVEKDVHWYANETSRCLNK